MENLKNIILNKLELIKENKPLEYKAITNIIKHEDWFETIPFETLYYIFITIGYNKEEAMKLSNDVIINQTLKDIGD